MQNFEASPPQTGGLAELMAEGEPVAATPSDYQVNGEAIADNRAWTMQAIAWRAECGTTCEITDKKTYTYIIDPGKYGSRVQLSYLYSPDSGWIYGARHFVRVYNPTAPYVGHEEDSDWRNPNWFYVGHPSIMYDGSKVIYGIETVVSMSEGNGAIWKYLAHRTLTASCFPDPDGWCEWWV